MKSPRTFLASLLLGVILLQSIVAPFGYVAFADDAPEATVSSDSDTSESVSAPADDGSEESPSDVSEDTTEDVEASSADSSATPRDAAEEIVTDETAPAGEVQGEAPAEGSVTEEGSSAQDTDPVSPAHTDSASGSGSSEHEDTAATSSPIIGIELMGTSTMATTTSASTTPDSSIATTTTATTTGPVIQSGQAVALANILNIVNTNLVNSTGNALLLNYTDQVTGPIDLRNGTPIFSTTSPSCGSITCTSTQGVSVNLDSDANIHNAVVLNATTGGNVIDTAGNAVINTGDAMAGLNLINIANTNIVDSNYLLVSMNAFHGVHGDIVFPSLTNLLASISRGLSGNLSLTGNADVHNNVTTDAQSGGNTVGNAASSTISTGAATSNGSVFNEINSNMFGGASVSILFRIQGSWAGKVFGAPQGLQWIQGPGGMVALYDQNGSGNGAQSLSQVTASSSASIDNDVNVVALTGDNRVDNADSALITTGTALASANVINVANTNIVGKNWIMAVINIFGDFEGDIAFGRPDLWVGEQVEVPSYIQDGSNVTYKFSVINNGDSDASDVILTDDSDAAHVHVQDSSVPYALDADGNLVWSLGTIPAGGAVEVSYTGRLQGTNPGTDISDTVHVGSYETDNNTADNTDTTTFSTSYPASPIHIQKLDVEDIADLQPEALLPSLVAHVGVARETNESASANGQAVSQKIALRNSGTGTSTAVVAYDLLQAPDGRVLHSERWEVGALGAGEGVELGYTLGFSAKVPSGTYYLSTVLTDENGHELARFVRNGSIVVRNSAGAVAGWNGLRAGALGTGSMSGDNKGSILGAVFPGVAVAHAADGDGDLAAAAGFGNAPWYALAGIFLLALAILMRSAYAVRKNA